MRGKKLNLLCLGIRGGVSVISHRHAKANVPNLPDYDPSKPNNHLMYLDANNLYGWAMSQPLPTGGFQWLTNAEILQLDIDTVPDSIGYFLEVDLEYPSGLHDLHADYPLAPGI